MLISAKRTILVGVSVLTLGGTMAAAGCSDRFATCKDNRTCAPAAGGAAGGNADDAGGRASADGGSGANESEGGRDSSGGAGNDGEPPAEGGSVAVGGAPSEEPQPPAGAFAWYKATEEDVTLASAALTDGNDFLKSSWVKVGLTAAALQPDADGGNKATVLYGKTSASTRTLQHAIVGVSLAEGAKTIRIRAKAGAYRYLRIGKGVVSNDSSASFDLVNGVATRGTAMAATITPLEGLWYSCEATLVSGPDVWFQVSSDEGQPATSEPLMWLQDAELDQRIVTGWKDRIGDRDFRGGIGGWRWLSATPEFGGLPALESRVSYSTKMVAGEASDWSFLHDGSGSTLVVLKNQTFFSKGYVNGLQTVVDDAHEGARLGTSANDDKLASYSVTNAGGKRLFTIEGGSAMGPKWIAGTYGADHTPQAQLFEQGIMVASGNSSSEPATSAGNLPLTLGGGMPTQLVREVLVYDRVLENDEIVKLKAYFAAQLGE